MFLIEEPTRCRELIKNKDHYLCNNDDFDLCGKYKCPFVEQGKIPYGDMEGFVKTKFSKLIIVNSYKIVPRLILGLIKLTKNRSNYTD